MIGNGDRGRNSIDVYKIISPHCHLCVCLLFTAQEIILKAYIFTSMQQKSSTTEIKRFPTFTFIAEAIRNKLYGIHIVKIKNRIGFQSAV